jgi:hypothetical protein
MLECDMPFEDDVEWNMEGVQNILPIEMMM